MVRNKQFIKVKSTILTNNNINHELPPFSLNTINPTDLLDIVKEINIHKSSGIRGLSSRILKDAMTIMSEEFTFLMNVSIYTGKVPHLWKKATVIPIPKIKNPSNVADLRPISLLPLPGKTLEKFVHKDLITYLETHDLLSKNQFGFRPGLSTSDAITELIDGVGINLNSNKLTIATFVDFAKAFDTLDHTLILDKLTTLNPDPSTREWFKSYLNNRSQITQI